MWCFDLLWHQQYKKRSIPNLNSVRRSDDEVRHGQEDYDATPTTTHCSQNAAAQSLSVIVPISLEYLQYLPQSRCFLSASNLLFDVIITPILSPVRKPRPQWVSKLVVLNPCLIDYSCSLPYSRSAPDLHSCCLLNIAHSTN